MNTVTQGNKKPSPFILRCAASGLFVADCTADFEVIAVTLSPERALTLPDGYAAEQARKMVGVLYPSFDWRAVERDAHTSAAPVCMFLRRQAA